MIELVRQFWHLISTPQGIETMIRWGGIPVVTAIIFAETGLLIGFIFPGDSLLFVAGFMASPAGNSILPIFWMDLLLIIAAISGNSLGYYIGHKAGPPIFNRPQSRFFRRDHLLAAHAFYEKHGGKTIIMAEFIPIIRTFTPVVAGAAAMNYRRFIAFNIIGSVFWVISMTMLGYFLGQVPWVQRNLEKAVVIVILLSISPGVIHYLSHRRKQSASSEQAATPAVDPKE
jgi:membrane-associated protein